VAKNSSYEWCMEDNDIEIESVEKSFEELDKIE
jgi:hypothetical protein